MDDEGLWLTGAAALAAAATFALAARVLHLRPVSRDNGAASLAFVAWWTLLSAQAFTDAGRVLLGLAPAPDVALFLALVRVKVVAAAAAVGAMTFYVLHLWGAPRLARVLPLPLAALHGVLFLYLLERRLPAEVEVGAWTTRLVLSNPPLLNAYAQMLGTTLFFLPTVAFALAYLALWGRARSRTGRVRIVGIALALVVFHVASVVQFDPDRSDTVLAPALALASAAGAALVLLVYRPPRFVQRRWGIDPLASARASAPGSAPRAWPARRP